MPHLLTVAFARLDVHLPHTRVHLSLLAGRIARAGTGSVLFAAVLMSATPSGPQAETNGFSCAERPAKSQPAIGGDVLLTRIGLLLDVADSDQLHEVERVRTLAWASGVSALAIALIGCQIFYVRQRRRTERALRDSEERFRAIFQQAGVGVAQTGLDGKVEIANDRYCDVVGHPRTDLVGRGTGEISFQEDLKAEIAMLPRLLAGEIQSFCTEKRYTRQDGVVVWATMWRTVVRDRHGRPKKFIAVVEDITERKRSEAALKESEERFRNLADSAPVMIWTCGLDKRGTFYNKGWLQYTGRNLETALADGWFEDIHPEDRERCARIYTTAFDARHDYQFECRLRRSDGEYCWFLCRGVARFLPDRMFAGYVGCGIDITDLKRNHERHLAMQKLESIGVLASGVAHDFNNVLGSIAALAESAQSEVGPDSLVASDLALIQQTALGASRIASQLMTFARHDHAPPASINISTMIREMLELLTSSIPKSAILETSLADDLPVISANPSEIRQLLVNLVSNASQALDGRQGTITIKTSTACQDGIPAACLEVADTGTGMSSDTQTRIFDPYFTTGSMGRGLGLSASQGIVRRLNGSIQVDSALGAGSRFIVLLPTGSETAAAAVGQTAEAALASKCKSVLYVDDEESLRSTISKLLRRRGFQVFEAIDGASAIACFRASEPAGVDVVLLDVTLPGMRASEVLDELRRIRADVKVVLCTAYSRETALAEFGDRKVDGFIRKPYRSDDLVNMLREL